MIIAPEHQSSPSVKAQTTPEYMIIQGAAKARVRPDEMRAIVDHIDREHAKAPWLYKMWMVVRDEATDELKWWVILHKDTPSDIVKRWQETFPEEAALFVEMAKEERKHLYSENGMSKGGTIMLLGKIPNNLYTALQAFDPGFWESESRDWRKFFAEFRYFDPRKV